MHRFLSPKENKRYREARLLREGGTIVEVGEKEEK
jgi:hypothetical protein